MGNAAEKTLNTFGDVGNAVFHREGSIVVRPKTEDSDRAQLDFKVRIHRLFDKLDVDNSGTLVSKEVISKLEKQNREKLSAADAAANTGNQAAVV